MHGQDTFHLLDVLVTNLSDTPHVFPATASNRGFGARRGLSLVPLSAPTCVSRPPEQSAALSSGRNPGADRCTPWRRCIVTGWDEAWEPRRVEAGRTRPAPDPVADSARRSAERLSRSSRGRPLPGRRFAQRPTTIGRAPGGPPEPAAGLRAAGPGALFGVAGADGHAVDDRIARPSIDQTIFRWKCINNLFIYSQRHSLGFDTAGSSFSQR